MNKLAIITDSNSGIRQKEADALGIKVLPMPFTINGETFYEDVNLSQADFYEKLMSGADVFTSQPLVGDVSNLWTQALKQYDEVLHIPMSSGLSGSCQTAMMLAEEYEGKVQVVDSQRISVTQKWDVLTAIELNKQGKDASEIKKILEETKFDSSIYITVNTLEYLSKGGRITPTAAMLGSMLKIKPILQLHGEKLDSFSKTRTMHKATKIMIDSIIKDVETRIDPLGKGDNVYICVAYTYDEQPALELKQQLEEIYPQHTILCDPLSLSVSCHSGPNALAIAACKKIV